MWRSSRHSCRWLSIWWVSQVWRTHGIDQSYSAVRTTPVDFSQAWTMAYIDEINNFWHFCIALSAVLVPCLRWCQTTLFTLGETRISQFWGRRYLSTRSSTFELFGFWAHPRTIRKVILKGRGVVFVPFRTDKIFLKLFHQVVFHGSHHVSRRLYSWSGRRLVLHYPDKALRL